MCVCCVRKKKEKGESFDNTKNPFLPPHTDTHTEERTCKNFVWGGGGGWVRGEQHTLPQLASVLSPSQTLPHNLHIPSLPPPLPLLHPSVPSLSPPSVNLEKERKRKGAKRERERGRERGGGRIKGGKGTNSGKEKERKDANGRRSKGDVVCKVGWYGVCKKKTATADSEKKATSFCFRSRKIIVAIMQAVYLGRGGGARSRGREGWGGGRGREEGRESEGVGG